MKKTRSRKPRDNVLLIASTIFSLIFQWPFSSIFKYSTTEKLLYELQSLEKLLAIYKYTLMHGRVAWGIFALPCWRAVEVIVENSKYISMDLVEAGIFF
jgi:hypothetical protein